MFPANRFPLASSMCHLRLTNFFDRIRFRVPVGQITWVLVHDALIVVRRVIVPGGIVSARVSPALGKGAIVLVCV